MIKMKFDSYREVKCQHPISGFAILVGLSDNHASGDTKIVSDSPNDLQLTLLLRKDTSPLSASGRTNQTQITMN